MSYLVKVTLDVYANDGITAAEVAEAVFDWSAQGSYERTNDDEANTDAGEVELIDYIAGYDWTTAQT